MEQIDDDEMMQRVSRLRVAFSDDGYTVREGCVVAFRGRIGMVAHHRTATNHDTGRPKRAYYVEGAPFEMGYLLGRLAEPEIDRMTETFIDRVVGAMVRETIHGERLDFTGVRGPKILSVHKPLVDSMHEMIRSARVLADVPIAIHQEIRGLVAGCRVAARLENRSTSVTEEELWVLNAGLDTLLARAYTGKLLPARTPALSPKDLFVPIACNGFAVLNEAAADGALLARDYMFPTGGVFHDAAALIVYRPDPVKSPDALPFVSMTAPGIVGSIAAMNLHGVAAGVDVAVGANCNPLRPGMNSLLLVRHAIEHGENANAAVDCIIDAQRGVTWNYIVADGGHTTDRACVVEAGATMEAVPFAQYPGGAIRKFLPDELFLQDHPSADVRRGAAVRWESYGVPEAYLDEFNPLLWRYYRRNLREDAFDVDGFINRRPSDRNCPGAFYFAPVRGRRGQVVLTTNHFVVPEMRLCTMHPWAARMSRARVNDSQWRYDELNRRILATLDRDGPMTAESARRVLGFLDPGGDYPDYYRRNPVSRDGKQKVIFGSASLFDLKQRTVSSHYGYYADEWVRIHLGRYAD